MLESEALFIRKAGEEIRDQVNVLALRLTLWNEIVQLVALKVQNWFNMLTFRISHNFYLWKIIFFFFFFIFNLINEALTI